MASNEVPAPVRLRPHRPALAARWAVSTGIDGRRQLTMHWSVPQRTVKKATPHAA
ncbi:hypothetical protein [Kineococcus glutinatus]